MEKTDVGVKPRLTLRVGITGHRTNVLSADDIERLRTPVGTVLDCLDRTARNVLADHAWAFSPAMPALRLATSLAEGADTLVAQEARRRGFTLDIFLPFNRADYAAKQGFDASASAVFNDLCVGEHVNSLFELEEPSSLTDDAEVNAAYLRAGQAVMSHADVMIAIWDGQPERGTGGTAQVVRTARAQGLLVIHIPTAAGETPKVWLPNELAAAPAEDGRWEPLSGFGAGVGAVDLAEVLSKNLRPPQEGAAVDRLQAFFGEPWRNGSFSCLYDALRCIFGGYRPFRIRVSYAAKEARETEWQDFLSAAATIGGPRFRDNLKLVLQERFQKADNAALHYSHAYRSGYIRNFVLAAFSVLVGLLSVLWWDYLWVKAVFVVGELALIGLILLNTRQARQQGWHQRWLEYRSLAEILRPSRLPALLGGAPAQPFAAAGISAGDAWVSWYVRASLREIGPPTGKVDRASLVAAIDAAMGDEIDRQIDYHGRNAEQLEKLNHHIHSVGALLFWITAIVGLAFLAFYSVECLVLDACHDKGSLTKHIKPLTTLLAATLPAFGSALFGIRATGDFVTFEKQSRRTAAELKDIREGLKTERAEPNRPRIARLFSMATHAMATDLRTWGLIYRERDISLP
ncbi:MAG: hypothetical protein AB7P12_02930 [Alphaproteobacteria bacterium]